MTFESIDRNLVEETAPLLARRSRRERKREQERERFIILTRRGKGAAATVRAVREDTEQEGVKTTPRRRALTRCTGITTVQIKI